MFDALGLSRFETGEGSVSNGGLDALPIEANRQRVAVLDNVASSGTSCPTTQDRVSIRGRVGEGRPTAFASETAAITGESKRSINQHLARAEALGDDLERTVGTSQRSSYTKRRKVIWEALHPEPVRQRFERVWDALPIEAKAQRVAVLDDGNLEVGQVAPPQVFTHGGARPQEKSFAASTAAITGENVRGIQRHLARAEALGDDLERTVGTSLDKGMGMGMGMGMGRRCHGIALCGLQGAA